ncbi:cyclopropane fatty acyl phospholipid synthase [Candidatus Uhrbacteria bacterium]|nr:cyclopropane fatty acyl phospholipid synthase [Candidatus Uhrbacteria bacterium]
MQTEKSIIESLLSNTGITINGNNPCDPQIHNEKFYRRVLRQGSLGLGESYMDGWWDCENLDQFFHKILSTDLDRRVKDDFGMTLKIALNFVLNAGRKSKAFEIGQKHYDIGNDLYRAMLDKRLTYTCGYWNSPSTSSGNNMTLDEAQEAKLDLTCRKIGLKTGQKILDIGCGWGSFVGFAAEKYKANALGITVSKEQKELAEKLYKNLPIEIRLQDYRDINEKFDHVVSLGMFEHVGYKNYRTYMEIVHKALNDDGLFLLHTIGGNRSVHSTDPWIEKYIFPNSMLPSINQISKSIEGLFVMEDWHNFGTDYDKTLMSWHSNFENGWETLRLAHGDTARRYDERFYRMWGYYLLACAGSFRARKNQLWQIVLSKKGVSGGYKSVR